jgi:hypothetical protein
VFKLGVKDDNYMTRVKPQISKFQVDKSCQVGFNVLRRLYSRAFAT